MTKEKRTKKKKIMQKKKRNLTGKNRVIPGPQKNQFPWPSIFFPGHQGLYECNCM